MTIHLLWISSKLCRKPRRHSTKKSLFISIASNSENSFPEKIAERRMCCFLFQEKVINLLKNCQSPVLLEVINSCNIKVSFSTIHFLVFGLAFNCSFILCKQKPKPISIVCFQTIRDRKNLLPLQLSIADIVGTELSDQKLSDLLTVVMLGRSSHHSLLGFVCVRTIHDLEF